MLEYSYGNELLLTATKKPRWNLISALRLFLAFYSLQVSLSSEVGNIFLVPLPSFKFHDNLNDNKWRFHFTEWTLIDAYQKSKMMFCLCLRVESWTRIIDTQIKLQLLRKY